MVFSHSWTKTIKQQRNEGESYIHPVVTGQERLSTGKYQHILERIHIQSKLDAAQFGQLYLPLIENFVMVFQSLPCYENQSSLHINVALSRALQMLESVSKSLSVHKNPYQEFSNLRTMYAIFSSALLSGIGLIDRDRYITLTDNQGHYQQDWGPITQQMMPEGGFYRVRFARVRSESYACAQGPILAAWVMPNEGMKWISEDVSLFLAWHRALHHFEDGYSDFELLHEINALWETVKHEDLIKVKADDAIYVKALESAEKFWQWLKEKIEKGEMNRGQKEPHMHLVDGGGVCIDLKRLFDDFTKTYPQFRDWVVVSRQFNHLGIVPQSGFDLRFIQFFGVDHPRVSAGVFGGIENQKKEIKDTVYFANVSWFVNPAALADIKSTQIASPKSGVLSKLFSGLLGGLLPGLNAKASRGGQS